MGCVSSKQVSEETSQNSNQTQKEPTKPAATSPATTNAPASNTKVDDKPKDTAASKKDEKDDGGDDDDLITIYEGIDDYYEIKDEELGVGGYSVVKAAKDKQSGEMVAVKIIDLDAIETDTAGVDPMLPLKREISIMQKIQHPHIIKLYKVFIEDEKFFMILELMPGGEELFRRIEKGGAFPEPNASKIFRQLVSAVQYLHNMGVAHRDLKPENVLVTGDPGNEFIKLADFGFAKHFKEEQMKTALGSPAYAAPELFIAETYSEAVDMWSLGVILYLLVSGIPPFYGETVKELTDRIINAEYDFDDDVWKRVTKAGKDVITRLLMKDPSKRYSAKQLLDTDWVQGKVDFNNKN